MKLKTTHAMALCALSLLATQSVWAVGPARPGNSKDLEVAGIIKPSACKINITGEVTFAPKDKKDIKPDAEGTDLGKPAVVPLEINCGETESTVGVGFTDNFNGTRAIGVKIVDPTDDSKTLTADDYSYGLGKRNEKVIGSYLIGMLGGFVGTESSQFALTKISDGTIINKGDEMRPGSNWLDNGNIVTWADSAGMLKGKIFKANLQVRGTLAPSGQMDLTDSFDYTASTKVTVYYF